MYDHIIPTLDFSTRPVVPMDGREGKSDQWFRARDRLYI